MGPAGRKYVSGIYRGKGECGEYLARLADKAVAVRALSFMADGDTVVAVTEVTASNEMREDADVYVHAARRQDRTGADLRQ